MPRLVFLLAVGCAATVVWGATREEAFEFGRFGQVHAFVPDGKPSSVALLAVEHWDGKAADAARSLLAKGALVAGIDSSVYLTAAGSSDEPCAYPFGELEDLAHSFERRYAMGEYITPILVGNDAGAGLWYAVLAQAPRGTFQALLTESFCPRMALTRPLCPGSGLRSTTTLQATVLEPVADLQARWTALDSGGGKCPVDVSKFKTTVPPLARDASKAGSPVVATPVKSNDATSEAIASGGANERWTAAYLKLAATETRAPLPEQVGDLPLIEVPAATSEHPHEDRFAVLLTGDGGWAGIDKDMAARLAAAGVPAVGLSTLKYFWHARTPAETARDLARVIRYYGAQWRRERVLLIGYSFGADVLPEVVNGLPADVKRRVAAVNLIGLSHNASFEIRVGGWLGQENAGSPIRPQIERLGGLPVVCIRGEGEDDSPCPELSGPQIHKVLLPGGHHYNGDYGALVTAILNGGGLAE